MKTQVSSFLRCIRARVDDIAIQRSTRTISSSLPEIFTELFQNARKAGATSVDVTLTDDPTENTCIVGVSDNGVGIVEPDVLLSYERNGWDKDLVEREDAAGINRCMIGRPPNITTPEKPWLQGV